MKDILYILLIIFVLTTSSFPQPAFEYTGIEKGSVKPGTRSGLYLPLLDTLNRWNVLVGDMCTCGGEEFHTHEITIDGSYNDNEMVYRSFFTYMQTVQGNSDEFLYDLAEDTLLQEVYVRHDGSDYLLYDFTVVPGNVFSVFRDPGNPTYQLTVDTVDTVTVYNIERKRIVLHDISGRPVVWLEGIGSLNGVVNVSIVDPIGDMLPTLLCYWNNDTLLFTAPNLVSCVIVSYVGIENADPFGDITAFPNPADKQLFISVTEGNWQLSLISPAGREMMQISGYGKESIDVSNLAAGIYIIKINAAGMQQIKKLIIY
ncbi:MAG: T9SS type A sorting domain-containing protein [Bacteroidota bacterium]